MNFINLTPHPVTINGQTFAPDGTVARLESKRELVVTLKDDIEIFRTVYGKTIGLPEGEECGRMFIVSALVRMANPTRWDLVSPADLVRDDKGNVIGCKSFDVN